MLALVFCAAVFSETVHCVTIYFNQLQYLRCGLPDRAIGAAFLIASLAGLCGPLSARLTRRMGRRPMGFGLLLLSALCMGLLALTRSGPLSILLVTLLTALAALFSPLADTLENEKIATPDRATVLSLNAMISDSLIVLLDIGLGRAADASLPLALGICGIACLGAAGLFRMVRVEPSLN
jgi:MFS family permease